MISDSTSAASTHGLAYARRAFQVAWGFWLVAATLGLLLRLQAVSPMERLNYGNFLHAHSHVAFLGWVFNAFFALALRFFVRAEDVSTLWRVFLVIQIAVGGMLVAFPLEGYAGVSIAFSTLQMVCSGVFAWKLWKRNRASPEARGFLRVALAFLVISGAGPLTLGPLAATGLRESPWYALAIYFYLHCQYNGWFMFFLQAVFLQYRHERGLDMNGSLARRSLGWLTAGCGLTFALSGLWTNPPDWVYVAAVSGGVAQLIGCAIFVRGMRGTAGLFVSNHAGIVRGLAVLALGAFLLKQSLQLAATVPGLVGFMGNRWMVIGFLHLIFLGLVTPMLVAWAVELDWIRVNGWTKSGLGLFLAGAFATELVLGISPLTSAGGGGPWPATLQILLAGAVLMVGGLALLAPAIRRAHDSKRAPESERRKA